MPPPLKLTEHDERGEIKVGPAVEAKGRVGTTCEGIDTRLFLMQRGLFGARFIELVIRVESCPKQNEIDWFAPLWIGSIGFG